MNRTMDFNAVLLGALLISSLAACQQISTAKLEYDVMTWRQECFGYDTHDCINRRVDLNLKVIDLVKEQIVDTNTNEIDSGRGGLNQAQLSAGFVGIDSARKAIESQRPSWFYRTFFGSSRTREPLGPYPDILRPDLLNQDFVARVVKYNDANGLKTELGSAIAQAEADNAANEDHPPSNDAEDVPDDADVNSDGEPQPGSMSSPERADSENSEVSQSDAAQKAVPDASQDLSLNTEVKDETQQSVTQEEPNQEDYGRFSPEEEHGRQVESCISARVTAFKDGANADVDEYQLRQWRAECEAGSSSP